MSQEEISLQDECCACSETPEFQLSMECDHNLCLKCARQKLHDIQNDPEVESKNELICIICEIATYIDEDALIEVQNYTNSNIIVNVSEYSTEENEVLSTEAHEEVTQVEKNQIEIVKTKPNTYEAENSVFNSEDKRISDKSTSQNFTMFQKLTEDASYEKKVSDRNIGQRKNQLMSLARSDTNKFMETQINKVKASIEKRSSREVNAFASYMHNSQSCDDVELSQSLKLITLPDTVRNLDQEKDLANTEIAEVEIEKSLTNKVNLTDKILDELDPEIREDKKVVAPLIDSMDNTKEKKDPWVLLNSQIINEDDTKKNLEVITNYLRNSRKGTGESFKNKDKMILTEISAIEDEKNTHCFYDDYQTIFFSDSMDPYDVINNIISKRNSTDINSLRQNLQKMAIEYFFFPYNIKGFIQKWRKMLLSLRLNKILYSLKKKKLKIIL